MERISLGFPFEVCCNLVLWVCHCFCCDQFCCVVGAGIFGVLFHCFTVFLLYRSSRRSTCRFASRVSSSTTITSSHWMENKLKCMSSRMVTFFRGKHTQRERERGKKGEKFPLGGHAAIFWPWMKAGGRRMDQLKSQNPSLGVVGVLSGGKDLVSGFQKIIFFLPFTWCVWGPATTATTKRKSRQKIRHEKLLHFRRNLDQSHSQTAFMPRQRLLQITCNLNSTD